jgi:hypothetical protein
MKFIRNFKIPAFPFYPLLFGIYPIVYLWSANRAQEPSYVILPPLLATLIGILVIYLLMFAIRRDWHRAALMTLVISLYLLSYGHIANLLTERKVAISQQVLIPVSAAIILALLVFIGVRRFGSPSLSKTLNLVSAALLIFPLVNAVPYYISVARLQASQKAKTVQAKAIPITGDEPARDVYFILLDNYGRQDILQKASKFDNSELINALKERGFVFPDCAQGNYFWTAPVISSILNMDYLDSLGVKESSYDRRGHYDDMAPLILDSEVMRKFKEYGYQTVTFRGFMGLIDIKTSDHYVDFEQGVSLDKRLETVKFESLYEGTTLFSSINDTFKLYPDKVLKYAPPAIAKMVPGQDLLAPEFYAVYQQNLYAFNELKNIPTEVSSPKFVYAHFYGAHWPFMTRPDGSVRLPFTQKITEEGYVDGVKFTNNQILGAIDSILANSKVPPVIILQGDHSNEMVNPVEWSGKDRMKILSAYYLPDGGDKLLYDKISPVNNFRLVFQKYFGEDIDLLPDVSHYLDTKTKKVTVAPETCISDSIQK